MLIAEKIQPSYVVAPDVYISSIEIFNSSGKDKIKFYFKVYDEKNPTTGKPYWSSDQSVLNSIYAYIKYGDETRKSLLKTLSETKKGTFVGSAEFDFIEDKAPTASAYCGCEQYSGKTTTETLYNNKKLDQPSKYVSKIKDLRLLSVGLTADRSRASQQGEIIYNKEIYVSYTTDKRIKIGIVLDLNAFLLEKSENYKLLSAYPNYKKAILDSSQIDVGRSSIYLSNVTTRDGLEKPCKFNFDLKRIDNADFKYLLVFEPTSYIDGSPIPPNKFTVKLKINVSDASETFFNDNIIERLAIFKSLTEVYHSKFVDFDRNSFIDDSGVHYYTHEYDKKTPYKQRTSNIIADTELYKVYADAAIELAEITSIFSSGDKDQLIKLYSTILHPLTTSAELLAGLASHIQKLYDISLQFTLLDTNKITSAKKDEAGSYTILFGSLFNPAIDLAYDAGYGYEVIRTDSYEARIADTNIGFFNVSTLLADELYLRNTLEANKYYNKPTGDTKKNLTTYSISMIDLGKARYNFVDAASVTPEKTNEAYVYLKELYRANKGTPSVDEIDYSFTYNYGKFGTIIYDIASSGVSIESIVTRNNGGNNNLEVNTLFDDSSTRRDVSLKYIADTGIQKLYFILDDIKFNQPPNTDTYLQSLAANNLTEQESKYPLKTSILEDPEVKSKNILLYNSIFESKLVITGSNYSLHRLDNRNVSEVFSGIRTFNKYYLVQTGTAQYNKTIPAAQQDAFDAMSAGKPAELMLRTSVSGPTVNIVEI